MADDCFIKIIARYLDRCGNHHTTKGNYRNVCGSAPDIDNHIAKRLGNINTGTDCCCNGFLNDIYFSRSRLVSSFFHSFTFHFCHAAWHADADPWLAKRLSSHCFLYKMFQHLLCDRIIGNHTLPQRTDCHDISRCSSDHLTCFLPDGFDLVCILIIRYYGRLF